MKFKFILFPLVAAALLQGCSTNPATGARQFTALMSPAQEVQVGAQEHEKIIKQFGLYKNPAVSSYVQSIGTKVTAQTERPDVQYKFYVLDSPIVNAFALPGGYIYVSRGLMALANNEAQLAAVLAHEAGHITGRHSAERYSRGVVTSLGAGVLGAVIGSSEASQALGVGANLYLSSYSRDQEREADSLGLRYMAQGGYDTDEMAKFLSALQAQSGLDAKLAGRKSSGFNYFSTHPATPERVRDTKNEAGRGYQSGGRVARDAYLRKINGLTYGDSAAQGFVRGQSFFHPGIGFTFDVPDGFKITNKPDAVSATHKDGSVIVFDMKKRPDGFGASSYMQNIWLKDKTTKIEKIVSHGMKGATASFPGTVNGKAVTIRLVAIEWVNGDLARFQIAYPRGASAADVEALRRSTYSFRAMNAGEKAQVKPYRLKTIVAQSGDTISKLAARLPYDDFKEDRFRTLNALVPGEALIAGQRYKIVTD